MNYLLYGTEKYLIDKEIKKIITDSKVDDINISKYNLNTDKIKDIIEDATTVSLFGDKKLIIVYDAIIFNRVKDKIDDMDLLLEYLNSKNDTIIIFINNSEKVDSTKKITKAIKDNGIIKEFNKSKYINSNILDMLDDYKMNNKAIDLLINRVGNDLEIISKEIEKLKIYKIDTKVITEEDIIDLCPENINIDIFEFVDNIINKKKDLAIKTYKELLKINEEPIKIIALLASKFRLMYQASILAKKGYTEDQISSILNVHKYPVHLAIISGYKYNPKILLKYLEDLADLDIGVKTGGKDANLALELFILNL